MSKKRTNSKSDLKKVLNRKQSESKNVTEQIDMHPTEEEITEKSPTNPDETLLSKPSDGTEESSSAKKEVIPIREYRPLSEEMRNKAIEIIKEKWPKMEGKQDLLFVLNVALVILYGESADKINMRTLNYYAYSTNNKKRYITFQIPKKKKGEFRTIDAPCASLKMIQRALNFVFQLLHTPHQAAMGFVQHRSVVTNAQLHVGQKYVYNIDLKNFFPSISSGRLFKRLQVAPFGLNKDLASIVSDLCCYTNAEGKNVLPQGAPTSPTITNFICEHLDRKLAKLANAYGMKYSRYADDITFSCMNNMFAEDGKFCKSLRHIIEEEEHLKINPDKTRLSHIGERQEVTGLTVNERPNVTKAYTKQLRLILHICEAKGLSEAQRFFEKHYTPKTLRANAGIPHVENVIAGKLLYLKMVKGEGDTTFNSLLNRWQKIEKAMQNTKESQESHYKKTIVTDMDNNPADSSLVQELNGVLDTIIQSYG